MIEINTVKDLIDNIFRLEPEAMVEVLQNENLIAILHETDWKKNREFQKKCKGWHPPKFIARGEFPFIGIVHQIKIQEGDTK